MMLEDRDMTRCFFALLLIVATSTGCSKSVSLRFYNHTDDAEDIELEGPGHKGDDEEIGKIPAFGTYRYDFKVRNKDMPAHFELEAGEDTEFTVNKHTPGKLYVDIYDDKLVGPNPRPAKKCKCARCRRK